MEYDEWDVRAEPVSNTLNLISRLAAAIRDLQQHTPPEGWRVTEYVKGPTYSPQAPRVFLSPEWGWIAVKDENQHSREHPTAAAAMAAIEETK
jgi:hypothetical protein